MYFISYLHIALFFVNLFFVIIRISVTFPFFPDLSYKLSYAHYDFSFSTANDTGNFVPGSAKVSTYGS